MFPSLIPTIACDVLHLVLVKVPRAKIHTAQHVPWWQIKEAFSVGVVGKARQWTIVGNMFGECHNPNIPKTSFRRFRKRGCIYSRNYKGLNISSLPKSPYFISGSQKSLTRLSHPFILFIYYWTCSNLMSWMLKCCSPNIKQ